MRGRSATGEIRTGIFGFDVAFHWQEDLPQDAEGCTLEACAPREDDRTRIVAVFSWNDAGVGESGDENFDAEKIAGGMGIAVKRTGRDRGLVELEELFGAVTCQGGLQRPVLQVASDPYSMVPASNSWDGHAKDSVYQRAWRKSRRGC